MLKIIVNGENAEGYKFLETITKRGEQAGREVESVASTILSDIKQKGDTALLAYSKKLDNASSIIRYGKEDFKRAFEFAHLPFRNALLSAAKNIEEFHKYQIKEGFCFERGGSSLGQIVRGLDRVGIYVPGGTAAYPSSVLMNAIPARLAGVEKIVMISPPLKNGGVNQDIMVAGYIAGVDELILVGGAHGIGALAYGTETIQKVDKIVGPGNAYVAAAKRLVYGVCDIDMVAGPSEILIIASGGANPKYIAADLMSQAEHDTLASSILVTTSLELAKNTVLELKKQIVGLDRKDIIKKSLENFGGIIVVDSEKEMIDFTNHLAPEHLEILTENPFEVLSKIKHAGSVFLGEYTPEPLGDYLAGSNHVLPTGGSARFFSPLSVDSFTKKIQYISYTKEELEKSAADIIEIANREGLDAHAHSVKVRLGN